MDVSASTPVVPFGHLLLLLALALAASGPLVAGFYLMVRLNRRGR